MSIFPLLPLNRQPLVVECQDVFAQCSELKAMINTILSLCGGPVIP